MYLISESKSELDWLQATSGVSLPAKDALGEVTEIINTLLSSVNFAIPERIKATSDLGSLADGAVELYPLGAALNIVSKIFNVSLSPQTVLSKSMNFKNVLVTLESG